MNGPLDGEAYAFFLTGMFLKLSRTRSTASAIEFVFYIVHHFNSKFG